MSSILKTGLVAGWLFCLLYTNELAAQGHPVSVPEPTVKTSDKNKADELFADAVKARMIGNDKTSEQLLQQFLLIKPNEPAAYYDLARLSYKINNYDKANEYIQKAITLDGKNKWYQEQYAYILASKNEFEKAGSIFMNIAKTEKHNNDYLLMASKFYQRAKKYKESLNALDELIKISGEDEDLLIQKQQIYLSMNDLPAATRTIQKLIDNNPHEAKYYALLAELYDNNKEPAKAAEVYTKAEKLFPDEAVVQLSLANHYRKLKDEVKYNQYIKKVIVNKDLDAETQISLLLPFLQEINADSTKRDDALKLAEEVVHQHPGNASVQAFYGDVLMLMNKRDDAAEQYKKSLKTDPSKYSIWQQLLYSYSDKASADSLLFYSEKALRLFPNQAVVHYLRGIAWFNKKNYQSAINAITRAIDLQPDDNTELLTEMYATLGDIYNITKEYTNSDSSYERALQLTPDNATVLNNYSYYLSERGIRLEKAEKMSKLSLQLRPDEATFLDTYGWILFKQGKYQQAKEYIQKAVDANPKNADATLWEHLGDINYKLNNIDKAVECWKNAREQGSDNPQIDKKIQERKLL